MWLEALRQNPAYTAPGAPFTLGPGVVPLFGALSVAQLNTTRALLEYVVAFANAKLPTPEEHTASLERRWASGQYLNAKQILEALGGTVASFEGLPSGSAQSDIYAAQCAELESFKSRQALFLPLLNAVASDRKQAAVQFLSVVKRLLSAHVWALPGIEGYHDIINDETGFYSYVGRLLLDEDQSFDLRRCEKCNAFFLVKPTGGAGRPQKRFCSKQCATVTHDSKSGERRRRSRARKKLEKSGYGPDKSRNAVRRVFETHPNATVSELFEHAKALLQRDKRKHK